MPKYHIEGRLKIEFNYEQVMDACSPYHLMELINEISKILVGDKDAFVDTTKLIIREIQYVNDKGKK